MVFALLKDVNNFNFTHINSILRSLKLDLWGNSFHGEDIQKLSCQRSRYDRQKLRFYGNDNVDTFITT